MKLTLVFLLAVTIVVVAARGKHKGQKQPSKTGGTNHGQPSRQNSHKAQGHHAVGAAAGAAPSKRPVLHGVNRAGSEFACIKGDGIFTEGPVDDASIKAMLTWKINAVRVPLNEDCWLGKNVPKPEHGGKNYQAAIEGFVKRLRAHNLYVILDLHWTEGLYFGKGQGCEVPAKCQKPMPDKQNAPQFWKEVAEAFKGDAEGVIFDLFNEPFPDMVMSNKAEAWKCWQKGGASCTGFSYEVAGMEDLIKAVRTTGAKNLLMLGGLTWANDLDGWLDHVPKGDKNIAASMHSYNFNECKDEACWERGIGKIKKAGYPVILGEIGEKECTHQYIDKLMPYLDKNGISYLAWTWNKWNCPEPVLITDYEGTPSGMGVGFKQHLASLHP